MTPHHDLPFFPLDDASLSFASPVHSSEAFVSPFVSRSLSLSLVVRKHYTAFLCQKFLVFLFSLFFLVLLALIFSYKAGEGAKEESFQEIYALDMTPQARIMLSV